MKETIFLFDNYTETGILHNMFKTPNYWDLFTFTVTPKFSTSFDPRNVFNFSNTKYWIGEWRSDPHNLTFCFRYFSVKAIGYEITTSWHTGETAGRAKKWGFSGSKDGIHWYQYSEVDYALNSSETYYVSWSSVIPMNCFKITTIESINGYYQNRFDLAGIDVYGYIVTTEKVLSINLYHFFSIRSLFLHFFCICFSNKLQ